MSRQLLQHTREVIIATGTSGALGSNDNPLTTRGQTNLPANGGYQFLKVVSGPSGTFNIDMNTNSAGGNTSLFEYQVPAGKVFDFNRVNFILTDDSINPGDFGGIAGGLPSGSSLELIDSDASTVLLDFYNGFFIKTNDDFAALAGTDIPITALPGDDLLPIRFSIFKGVGGAMRMTAGQRIRWTNRDNLSAITKFRAMVQGRLDDA